MFFECLQRGLRTPLCVTQIAKKGIDPLNRLSLSHSVPGWITCRSLEECLHRNLVIRRRVQMPQLTQFIDAMSQTSDKQVRSQIQCLQMLGSQQSIGKWTLEIVQRQYQLSQIIMKATYKRSQSSCNGSVREINLSNGIESVTK